MTIIVQLNQTKAPLNLGTTKDNYLIPILTTTTTKTTTISSKKRRKSNINLETKKL
jgi:hypothetical protein